MLITSVLYAVGIDLLNFVKFASVEYFVLSMVIFGVWWLIIKALEYWVFGPADG